MILSIFLLCQIFLAPFYGHLSSILRDKRFEYCDESKMHFCSTLVEMGFKRMKARFRGFELHKGDIYGTL